MVRLERQAGQKESRWAQLVGGNLPAGEVAATAGSSDDDETAWAPAPPAAPRRSARDDDGETQRRIAALEAALAAVRGDLDQLRAEYDDLSRELR